MVSAESCHPAIGIWLDANESAFMDQTEFLIGSALQFPQCLTEVFECENKHISFLRELELTLIGSQ